MFIGHFTEQPWQDQKTNLMGARNTTLEISNALYYGNEWSPEEADEVETNREMAARLLWKPYMKNRTLAHLLEGVDTETLLVWGREDRIIPVSVYQQFQRAIKGSKVRLIEDCGHMPEMEKPSEFTKAVLDFFK